MFRLNRQDKEVKLEAIKPSIFNIQAFKAKQLATKKGATVEETALYAMSKSKGWKILAEYIKTINEQLNQANREAISKGLSLKEIGQNAVVINWVKDVLDKIVYKVEDAKEACET